MVVGSTAKLEGLQSLANSQMNSLIRPVSTSAQHDEGIGNEGQAPEHEGSQQQHTDILPQAASRVAQVRR